MSPDPNNEDAALQPGALLGPYRLGPRLGAGGMGVVYRAHDERLDREVALKVLPSSFCTSDRLKRFVVEARAAAALSHPNVLAVFDVSVDGAQPYLVTELLEGRTFAELLREGPPPLPRAVGYALQIARGLAAAHERGIVHRDLKPSNLFLTTDGTVKILDFGLAKITEGPASPVDSTAAATGHPDSLDRLTADGAVLGTVGYMAPEQVQGRPADARSDLFAFGCVLHELVSGTRAFVGPTPLEISFAVLREEPTPLPESVPQSVVRVIRRCLAKAPLERFQSARDLAFVLDELATGPSTAGATQLPGTGPTGSNVPATLSAAGDPPLLAPPSRAPGPTPRRTPVLLALGVATVAAATAAGWVARARHDRPVVVEPPAFQRITYRRGTILRARFTGDGRSLVFAAAFGNDPPRVFLAAPGVSEHRPLTEPGVSLAAVSPNDELALLLDAHFEHDASDRLGTLARSTLSGAAPRPLLDNVTGADFGPDGSMAVVHVVANRNRLEYPIGHVLYETPGLLIDPRVSPDGRSVAVIDRPSTWGSGRVLLVDNAGKRRVLHENSAHARGLAWAGNDEVWVTLGKGSLRRQLVALSREGRERPVLGGADDLWIFDRGADGRLLLGSGAWRTENAMGRPEWPADRPLDLLDSSWAVDISGDGSTIAVDHEPDRPSNVAYVQRVDGGSPLSLGAIAILAISDDGKWVAATPAGDEQLHLSLVPTGPGATRELPPGGLTWFGPVAFLPEAAGVVFVGRRGEEPPRLYRQDAAGGPPQLLSTEGETVSPSIPLVMAHDGRWLVFHDGQGLARRLPIDGGASAPLVGLGHGDQVIQLTSDGKMAFVQRTATPVPAVVERVDLATGARSPWRTLSPADPVGVGHLYVHLARGGAAWVHECNQVLFDLYLVSGVR